MTDFKPLKTTETTVDKVDTVVEDQVVSEEMTDLNFLKTTEEAVDKEDTQVAPTDDWSENQRAGSRMAWRNAGVGRVSGIRTPPLERHQRRI